MALSRRTIITLAAVAALVVFLAGFLPTYIENRRISGELNSANDQLLVLRAQSELGMVLIEVAQDNYGKAKEQSTKFFNSVRNSTQDLQDQELKDRLLAILDRRDEINSDLTAMSAEISVKLRALYLELYRSVSSKLS